MDDAQNAMLIRGGAASVNPFRKDNPAHRLRAINAAFEDLNLSGTDLSGANLGGSSFTSCNLSNVNFENADLSKVKFEKCDLSQVRFNNTKLSHCVFDAVNLDGARFVNCATLPGISRLDISYKASVIIEYDKAAIRFIDKGPSWERLRFLSKLKIFVPAYASLSLCVIYVSACAWYNSQVEKINLSIDSISKFAALPHIDKLEPGLRSGVLMVAFLFLSIAATTFVLCPPRVVEFTRERWVNELSKPEILYDHASWSRRWLRTICATSLIVGGALSAALLADGIARQITFIIKNAF